jgi:hypothetical protein
MRWLVLSSVVLFGCSDLENCPEGQVLVDDTCVPCDEFCDPPPKTKTMSLACTNNTIVGGFSFLPWDLTVDPRPIVSGEPFAANFEALARFPIYFLNAAQGLPGGVTRANLGDIQATVHVRRGAIDPTDVTLTLAPIQRSCRYDNDGNYIGPSSFPTCSANDNQDGSNDDCTGLGGKPSPENPCGQFVDIPVSHDCARGGICESLGEDALRNCLRNGFCVTAPIVLALEGELDGYVAASAGHVLFGWDDASTGATIDQTSGPNDGTWYLPDAVFDEDPGPNGMRWTVGDLEIALECTMGVSSWGPLGVDSRNNLSSPAPDHTLISFPIQQPVE